MMLMKKKRPLSSLQIDIPALDEDDFIDQLTTHSGSTLLLGMFTAGDLRKVLERSGIFPDLRLKGIDDFIIKINPLEDFDQVLKIYSQKQDNANLLAELRLKEGEIRPPQNSEDFVDFPVCCILSIEWMMMQNPFKVFNSPKAGLPGQEHPGLGQARRVLKLIIAYCRLKNLDGVVNFPEYFHNAYLYRHVFKFYDPTKEAEFYAVLRDAESLSLTDLSWAVNDGCVINLQTGEPYDWHSDIQIFPLTSALQNYFQSKAYQQIFNKVYASCHFKFDEEKYKKTTS